ncbi:MAG: hypothetical protein H7A46_12585 [Verrucomicrobiales bacterium]|nr:hypothetical protein [Verrucomicrobiales bacterium]
MRTNLLEFETLEFDLKWDTGNATLAIDAFNNTGGDNGLAVLSARYVAPDWDWSVYLSNVLVPGGRRRRLAAHRHSDQPVDPKPR